MNSFFLSLDYSRKNHKINHRKSEHRMVLASFYERIHATSPQSIRWDRYNFPCRIIYYVLTIIGFNLCEGNQKSCSIMIFFLRNLIGIFLFHCLQLSDVMEVVTLFLSDNRSIDNFCEAVAVEMRKTQL